MFVEVVSTDGTKVLGLNLPGGPVPVAGDVFQTPDNKVWCCIQRTFLFRQAVAQVVDLAQGRPVQIAIQCVVEFIGEVQEGDNAIIK